MTGKPLFEGRIQTPLHTMLTPLNNAEVIVLMM